MNKRQWFLQELFCGTFYDKLASSNECVNIRNWRHSDVVIWLRRPTCNRPSGRGADSISGCTLSGSDSGQVAHTHTHTRARARSVQFVNALTTSWPSWHTRSGIHQLLHTSAITSDLDNLHATSVLVLHPHLCYTNRLPELLRRPRFPMLCSCRL